jgi:hypothetical protein
MLAVFTPQMASEQPQEMTEYAAHSAFASQKTSARVKEHGLVLASTSWNTDGPQLAGKASGMSADAPSSPPSSPPPSFWPALPPLDPELPLLDPLVIDPPPLPLEPDEELDPLDPPLLLDTLLSPGLDDVSVVPPQPAASAMSAAARPLHVIMSRTPSHPWPLRSDFVSGPDSRRGPPDTT